MRHPDDCYICRKIVLYWCLFAVFVGGLRLVLGAASDAMPVPKKNVAYRVLFYLCDAVGDPVTSGAGLDCELSKDGAAFGDATNAETEIGNGWYYVDLDAGEMNHDSVIAVLKTSTADAKQGNVVLYPEEAGDIRTDVTEWKGSTAPAMTGDAYARIGAAGVGLTAVALADATSDAVIADAVWNAATDTYGSAGSYGLLLETNLNVTIDSRLASATYVAQTGDSFARLGAPVGASISADIAGVPTVAELDARTILAANYFDPANDAVANVTTVGTLTGHTAQSADHTTGLADIPTVAEFNARSILSAGYFVVGDYTAPLDATGVRGAVGLAAANLGTQLGNIPTVAEFELRTLDAASYAIEATLAAMKGAGFVTGDDSLEAIRDRGDDAWTTGAGGDATLANQITLLARLSAARATSLDNLDATVSSRSSHAATDVPTLLLNTTVAIATDQTHLVLAAGPDFNAFKNHLVTLYDASNSDYTSSRRCTGYVGATRTLTLQSAPDFTVTAGDKVRVFVSRDPVITVGP